METAGRLTPEKRLKAFEQKTSGETDFIAFSRTFIAGGVLPKVDSMSKQISSDQKQVEFIEWVGRMVRTVLDNRKKQGMILGLDKNLVEFRNIDFSAAEHILDGKVRGDVTRGLMVGYLTSKWSADMDIDNIRNISDLYREEE